MNVFTGVAMLVLAGFLYINYKPKSQESRLLCAMTGLMGFFSLVAGTGNWTFQAIQFVLQAVVGFCSFIRLRQEKIVRTRRAARKRAYRPGAEPQQKVKTCA